MMMMIRTMTMMMMMIMMMMIWKNENLDTKFGKEGEMMNEKP